VPAPYIGVPDNKIRSEKKKSVYRQLLHEVAAQEAHFEEPDNSPFRAMKALKIRLNSLPLHDGQTSAFSRSSFSAIGQVNSTISLHLTHV
jgi:hypothetical protein